MGALAGNTGFQEFVNRFLYPKNKESSGTSSENKL
jgi:hypothetical protein